MPELSSRSEATPEIGSDMSATQKEGQKLWLRRRHLLDTRDLLQQEIDCLLHVALQCKRLHQAGVRRDLLVGKTVANLFYENSTRTRASFELAARQLGADVLNLDTNVSSVTKGETLLDTARQLVSMRVDAIVQRHSSSGSAHQIAAAFGDRVHVINAGDGWNGHPSQGLLDLLTMTEVAGNLSGSKVTIVGDILHSRVARSNLWLLKKSGADVHFVGPPALLPRDMEKFAVTTHSRLEPAIENSDFVIVLRLQLERQKQGLMPGISEYKKLFRVDHARMRLAKPGAKVLHPGPVNRGIEITDELVEDKNYSLIDTQVANGVAVRMAVLYLLLRQEEEVR